MARFASDPGSICSKNSVKPMPPTPQIGESNPCKRRKKPPTSQVANELDASQKTLM